MMRTYLIVICVMALIGVARSALAAHDGTYLAKVTTEYVTPHLSWAKPLAGGPIKVLFIVPRNIAAREVVELAQRLDLDFTAVTTADARHFTVDNPYEAGVTGTSLAEKTAELLAALDKKYDAIVLANFSIEALPAEAQYRILKQAHDGAGLLFTYKRDIPYPKLFATPVNDATDIAAGVGFGGLPAAITNTKPDQLVRTFAFGEGRIVRLDYPNPPSCGYGGLGLTVHDPYSQNWSWRYENQMVLVARTLLWAAGRPREFSLQRNWIDAPIPAADVCGKGLSVSVGSAGSSNATLTLRLRDAFDQVVAEETFPLKFTDKTAAVTFKPRICPGGLLNVDAIVRSDKGVEALASWNIIAPSEVGHVQLATDKPAYEAGEPMHVTLTTATAAARPLQVHVRLADSPYGRVWLQKQWTLPAGQSKLDFSLNPIDWPTPAGILRCDIRDDANLLAETRAEVFFPKHTRPLFSAVAWNIVADDLQPFYARQVIENTGWPFGLAWPSANADNARIAALFDQRMVPYVARIMVKSDVQGNTIALPHSSKTKPESLGNDASFYNPRVQAEWRDFLDRYITHLPRYGPLVYSLGDENFFSYDAGYSPSDQRAFKRFLRDRYNDIARLNTEWRTHYANFDEVPHLPIAQLKAGKNYAAWFDHRAFMEKQYADLHHFLARHIRDKDPNAKVGAEGSVPGDLEKTIAELEFWGPYSNLVEDEVLRCIGADKFRTLWWGGYVASHGGRDGYPFPLWRPLLQGTVNGSSWFTSGVYSEGFLAADFTYAEYFKQLLPHLHRLQNGIAQLLIDQPLRNDGIAVLWSHPSNTATLMDSRFFNPKDGIATLLSFCNRKGLTVNFVTPSMMKNGALRDARFLFLAGTSAMSDAEVREIRDFADRGGIVVADLNPAIVNEYLRPLDRSSLADFFDAPQLTGQQPLSLAPVNVEQTVRGQSLHFRAEKAWQPHPAFGSRVHPVGKGLAILLNFNLGSASHSAAPDTPLDDFLLALLKLANIQPAIQASGVDDSHLLLRVREKKDCTTVGFVVGKKDLGKQITLKFPRNCYIYRADGGYIGYADHISHELTVPFDVLCLFPQKQSAPTLRLNHNRLPAGSALRIDGDSLNANAMYRLQVFDAHDQPMPQRIRIFSGRGTEDDRAVRWAFNDEPGTYALVLTDLRTGLIARQSVTIR